MRAFGLAQRSQEGCTGDGWMIEIGHDPDHPNGRNWPPRSGLSPHSSVKSADPNGSTAMSSGACHTGNSRLIDADAIPPEAIDRRKWIECQDWAFVAQLRAAILAGLETPSGVLGHEHGPPQARSRF